MSAVLMGQLLVELQQMVPQVVLQAGHIVAVCLLKLQEWRL